MVAAAPLSARREADRAPDRQAEPKPWGLIHGLLDSHDDTGVPATDRSGAELLCQALRRASRLRWRRPPFARGEQGSRLGRAFGADGRARGDLLVLSASSSWTTSKSCRIAAMAPHATAAQSPALRLTRYFLNRGLEQPIEAKALEMFRKVAALARGRPSLASGRGFAGSDQSRWILGELAASCGLRQGPSSDAVAPMSWKHQGP